MALKKILKKLRDNCKCVALSCIHLRNYIFLEGKPDFQDNARFVFDEMVKRHWNDNYIIFWAVDNPDNFKNVNIKNVYFVKKGTKKWTRISRQSRVLLSCNFSFYNVVPRKDNLNIYLCHGATFKYCGNRVKRGKATDYINILSPYLKEAELRVFGGDEDRLIYFGFPRNDIFYQENKINLHKIFADINFDKCIVWMPTFRQNLSGTRNYSSISQPIIHNEKDAQLLNEYAKKHNILIILKPHFNQNMENIKKLYLSNLLIVDDSYFEKKQVLMYEVLAASDALITDYSSVFWDYLNADKPIGLCWEDFDEFNEKNGFNVDVNPIKTASILINSMEDFYKFIDDLSKGIDVKAKERSELNLLINGNINGSSSKKIVDFIDKKLKEL